MPLRTRSFAFLTCLGCRFFYPKRLHPEGLRPERHQSYIGFCTAEAEAVWIVWPGLEEAAAGAGRCPDREPTVFVEPRCAWFDTTTESASGSYPYTCIYYGTGVCPYPVGAGEPR